jgi:hypothetical protein
VKSYSDSKIKKRRSTAENVFLVETGWTTIKNIMRHRLADRKKMFRITTHWGG